MESPAPESIRRRIGGLRFSYCSEYPKASIANKLARSTLTAAFFLACLAAMELEG
ncbi:DUF6471 domain-containing protein [Bradyrhizobium sp.]|uniref:DUF6471 domain-containing protein n=1 Tax=Bradyrhizobium sp. TaxID=376 RepID=UPI003C744326